MPGAIVLAGWTYQFRGQLPKAPVHPSLKALVGESLPQLENMIDKLFSLHDRSPPMLLQGGSLRPMMHAMLATLIMYTAPACMN